VKNENFLHWGNSKHCEICFEIALIVGLSSGYTDYGCIKENSAVELFFPVHCRGKLVLCMCH